MRYLVTGGAGFIGSHLVDKILEKGGDSVVVYDNLSSGKEKFLAGHLGEKNFRLVVEDLLEFKKIQKEMKSIDFVYHLAANPDIRHGIKQTDTDLKQGTFATYNVLEAMRLNKVKNIAFSSSSVVYGEAKKVPTPEEYGPLMPISLYGASKLASEGLMTAYANTFGMNAWIFRFANIIGARSTHGILVDLIEKLNKSPRELEILGDGKQKKSYLMVSDVVEAMLFAVDHAKENVNIFNLGCQDNIPIARIARILLEEADFKNVCLKYTGGDRGWKGDVPLMLIDTAKINKLGWSAKHTSEEAIRLAAREVVHERLCKQ